MIPDPNSDILSAALDVPAYRPRRGRALRLGFAALACMVAAAVLLPLMAVRDKERQFHHELEHRLAILAEGRAQVIATWLDGLLRLTDRVTGAEMIRLFITEADLALRRDDATLRTSVAEQAPLVQAVLREYAAAAGFSAAAVIDRDGGMVVASRIPALTPEQTALAMRVFDSGQPAFAPLAATAAGVSLDLYLPLQPPQAGTGALPSGVLLLRLPVSARLVEFLAPSPLFQAGERFRLMQGSGDTLREIRPEETEPLGPVPSADSRFGQRPGRNGTAVYSLAVPVAQLGWSVAVEADADAARADLAAAIRTVIVVAVLVVAAVLVAFGAIWWKLLSDHNRSMAEQFRTLARQIDTQRQVLDTITRTIREWIGLKGPDGRYLYVNPAFAEAMRQPAAAIVGLADAALFDAATAERLRQADRQVLQDGRPVILDACLTLDGREHHLQVSTARLPDGGGIVAVSRDVTEAVLLRLKREKAMSHLVLALVRAVELRDPYLAGHSRRLAGLATAVARQLGTTPEVQATVEIAANLSQVGKLSISRALLNKPDRLTPEEQRELQGHVDHVATVLADIDFDLPVLQTIEQMNERLDGSGYPRGITGQQLSPGARILGVCDVYCARIAPRSYRPPIPANEALAILRDHPNRYDPDVVEALAAVAGNQPLA